MLLLHESVDSKLIEFKINKQLRHFEITFKTYVHVFVLEMQQQQFYKGRWINDEHVSVT